MAIENPTWGARGIHGEIQRLGFVISERTVARYVRQMRPRSDTAKHFPHSYREISAFAEPEYGVGKRRSPSDGAYGDLIVALGCFGPIKRENRAGLDLGSPDLRFASIALLIKRNQGNFRMSIDLRCSSMLPAPVLTAADSPQVL